MMIEKIFRSIPIFKKIVLDTVLFESKYPIMFTCKNSMDIYLFICCLVNSERIEWIGTKTTYSILIELLQNRITIRDAFLNVTDEKIIIEYNGKNVDYQWVQSGDIQREFLPTKGEFMDADDDEYAEEIAIFKKRNENIEVEVEGGILIPKDYQDNRYVTIQLKKLLKRMECRQWNCLHLSRKM